MAVAVQLIFRFALVLLLRFACLVFPPFPLLYSVFSSNQHTPLPPVHSSIPFASFVPTYFATSFPFSISFHVTLPKQQHRCLVVLLVLVVAMLRNFALTFQMAIRDRGTRNGKFKCHITTVI